MSLNLELLTSVPEVLNYPSLESIQDSRFYSDEYLDDLVLDNNHFFFEERLLGRDFDTKKNLPEEERKELRRNFLQSFLQRSPGSLEQWFSHLVKEDQENASGILTEVIKTMTSFPTYADTYYWINAIGSTVLRKKDYGDIDLLIVSNDFGYLRMNSWFRSFLDRVSLFFDHTYEPLARKENVVVDSCDDRTEHSFDMEELIPKDLTLPERVTLDRYDKHKDESFSPWVELGSDAPRGLLTLIPRFGKGKKIQITFQQGINYLTEWVKYERMHTRGDSSFASQCGGERIPISLVERQGIGRSIEFIGPYSKSTEFTPAMNQYVNWEAFISSISRPVYLPLSMLYDIFRTTPEYLKPSDKEILAKHLDTPIDKIPPWLDDETYTSLHALIYDFPGQMILPFRNPGYFPSIPNSDKNDRLQLNEDSRQGHLFL